MEKQRIRAVATVTGKGQITLPKAIRDHFGLKPGDKVEFVEDEAGTHLRRVVDPARFERWYGYLKDAEGRSSDEIVKEMRDPEW